MCVCVCLSVCEQVFSRAVSAVGTERGGMDKHHGRSVQQETGAALATEMLFHRVCINSKSRLPLGARRSLQLYTP